MPDGTTKDIYVDSDSASLNGIAKPINSDKSNGLNARVVNDGTGSDAPGSYYTEETMTPQEQNTLIFTSSTELMIFT